MVNSPKTDPPNTTVEEKPVRGSSGVLGVSLCWLGVAVMVYVLSLGPVMRIVQDGFIPPGPRGMPTINFIITFYYPIQWAENEMPMLNRPMGMYLHLWAPKMFDSKGNPTPQHGAARSAKGQNNAP